MNYSTLKAEYGPGPDDLWLRVDITRQQIHLLREDTLLQGWPVSTAARGSGQQNGSLQTPLGMHRIAEKIGEGAVAGSIFRARRPTGEMARILTAAESADADLITTRILWLDGLQPGFNQGGNVDTRQRYIYIHGTAEEGRIGQPVSHGCIRMKNNDIIELFAQIAVDTRVYIAEST